MSSVYDVVERPARREMVLFLLIDQSGSMEGTKIGAVNTAVREFLPEIPDEVDAAIKIAALLFSNNCHWVYDSPRPAADFEWNDIKAEGLTDLGAACCELDRKMSRHEFLTAPTGAMAPAVILLSDGEATDDYKTGLNALWSNNFGVAITWMMLL